MNAKTPPSRKVAKPKNKSVAHAQQSDVPNEHLNNAVPTTPHAPNVPDTRLPPNNDRPTFIEGEKPAKSHGKGKKGKMRHQRNWEHAPSQDKSQVSATQTTTETTTEEMGPQTRHLTLLGNKTVYSDRYTPAILEAFDNRHPENDYFVKFNCPEFTSLCPITGQPDFATIYISYIPDKKMVESKSLKLYLFGFRNHGAFHEDCVNIIMKDLIQLMSPRYIEVWGKFLPRGGLSIDPYVNYGRPTTRWEEFARQRLLMHDLSPERIDNR